MLHDVNPMKLYIQKSISTRHPVILWYQNSPVKIIPLQTWHSRVHLGKIISEQLPQKYIASHGASKHQLNYESSWFYGMVDVLTIDIPIFNTESPPPFI